MRERAVKRWNRSASKIEVLNSLLLNSDAWNGVLLKWELEPDQHTRTGLVSTSVCRSVRYKYWTESIETGISPAHLDILLHLLPIFKWIAFTAQLPLFDECRQSGQCVCTRYLQWSHCPLECKCNCGRGCGRWKWRRVQPQPIQYASWFCHGFKRKLLCGWYVWVK